MNQYLNIDTHSSCRFCNPPDKERILFDSENFYIMLSLGPITEGYVLLVSKNHYESCAAIPNVISNEFDFLYQKIKNILNDIYGKVVCFEHGRSGSCLSILDSQHCYHAHMHFVPVSFDMNQEVSKLYNSKMIGELADFRYEFQNGLNSYLFVDDGQKKIYMPGQLEVKRQYLRSLVASQVGDEDSWDWLKYPNLLVINSGKITLTSSFDALKLSHAVK